MMNREECLKLLAQYVQNPNMFKHCLASEAVLAKLAERLDQNKDKWATAGLLHDLDVEITHADLKVHGQKTAQILRELNFDDEIIDAIIRHNEESTDLRRNTPFHFALAAGETITGLITATTLVYPDKKIAGVKAKSIVKRMKEKAFAASVNRDIIMECEKLGLGLDEFAEISLEAMKSISSDLGL